MDQLTMIKTIIEDILTKLTVNHRVDLIETADGYQFTIKTTEEGLLIGENGKNLISLNHIIKKIASRKLGESVDFSLDVNDYQTKKTEELKNLARVNAQRVRYFKKEVALRPMSSFERRIVHICLADYPDIITASQGKEPERQVVIQPYP